MEKTTFDGPREVTTDAPNFAVFAGKVSIAANPTNTNPYAVDVLISLEELVATPEGFGSALGMAAREYMQSIPLELHATATLQLFMAVQKAFMRSTEPAPAGHA